MCGSEGIEVCGGTARVCVCVRTACEVFVCGWYRCVCVCVCGQCMYVDPIHITFQYSS